jgi:uncharacterized membrane protein YqjE
MIGNTTRSPNPAGYAGLLENLLALTSALTEFFESRFTLFAQESKSALMQLLVLAACSILALVSCVLGYIFLIASGVVGLAHLAGISWVWIALAAAAAHFVIAFVLLLVTRRQMSKPFFRATLTELKEDREWVKNLNATNQSTS